MDMARKVNIGVVCLARQTFDHEAARQKYLAIQKDLASIEGVEFHFVPDLLFELEDAQRAAGVLQGHCPDGLVCISGTFHLGYLVLELVQRLRLPVLLWGLQELPYDSGKIRLNSVCGVHLDASNLYKAGLRNYYACFGDMIDRDWLTAICAISNLGRSRVALLGSRAHTFYNLDYDELDTWRDIGVVVDQFPLHELFDWPIDKVDEESQREKLEKTFVTKGISKEQTALTARLAAKLEGFMEHHRLDALALRCWPEFASVYGIAPCGAISQVQARDKIIACEGDVEGAFSMLLHRFLGAETPFLADLSQVNFDADEVLLWHCGVAPCNLWDGKSEISLDSYHAGGKGVTAGFVLKEGPISLLRLDSAGRERRAFYKEGLALPMEKELKGTYARVKFKEGVRTLMGQVIDNGIAHHLSVAYGEFGRILEIITRIKQWPVIK